MSSLIPLLACLLAVPATQEGGPALEGEAGRRLAGHAFLSRIAWERDDSLAPAVVLTQPPVPAAGAASFHGPWLQALEARFVEQYATPLELPASPGTQVALLLASEAEWNAFVEATGRPRVPVRHGTYDPALGMSVACEGPRGAPGTVRREPLLRAWATSLLARHSGIPGGELPRQLWICEGLPAYLAHHTGRDPSTLATSAIDPVHLDLLAEAALRPDLRTLYLPSLREIVAARAPEDVLNGLRARARAANAGDVLEPYALRVFDELAVLWMHYLHDGDGGAHRPKLMAYLREALRGSGSPQAFEGAFGGAPEELEEPFLVWALRAHAELRPDQAVPLRHVQALLAERGALRPAGVEASASRSAALAPDPEDGAVQHAMIVDLAERGQLIRAAELAEALWNRERDGAQGPRLGRELERLRQFRRLRDAFLDEAASKGRRLSFEVGGKRRTIKVLAINAGVLQLDDKRGELEQLPVEELAPRLMVKDMEKLSGQFMPTEVPLWMRVYGYVLSGDDAWEDLLDDTSSAARALRDDAAGYPELLRTGRAARALTQLAERRLPLDDEAALEVVEEIGGVVAEYGELEVVLKRWRGLEELAHRAQDRLFEREGLRSLFKGAYEELGDGRVRIKYGFSSPEELEDFTARPDYLEVYRTTLPALKSAGESRFEVEEGALHTLGAGIWQHRLAFSAPITVSWTIEYGVLPRGGQGAIHSFLAVCDDGDGNYASYTGKGGLVVVDRVRGFHQFAQPENSTPFKPRQVYEMKLEHDGRVLRSFVDGERVEEAPCGPRKAGAWFWFVHSDIPAKLDKLVFEGRVEPADRDAFREGWIAERLVEMGFGE